MKTIFSKLALASIAMVGLFSSCVVDDIQTTFDLNPAECTINTHVVYALTGEDITAQTTITPGASYKLTANSHKGIDPQAVTINAQFKNLTPQSQTVNVAALAAGAVATYDVYFFFGSEGDLEWICNKVGSDDTTDIDFLTNSHFAHADGEEGWLYNDTEFIYDATVQYQMVKGGKVTFWEPEDNDHVIALKDGIEAGAPEVKTIEEETFQVSAWAMYSAWVEHTTSIDNYEVIEKNTVMGTEKKIGSFDFQYVSSCVFDHAEKENPGHAGHYVPGHGHGHGSENAGGGIIWAD